MTTARRASSAEQDVRDELVSFLRARSRGRIIHELNVRGQGSQRIDVALVEPEFIAAFEIKSEKDDLKRLDDQSEAFRRVSHFYRPVLHEKHYVEHTNEHNWTCIKLAEPSSKTSVCDTWKYPRPVNPYEPYTWDTCRRGFHARAKAQPRAADLLGLLWRDELINTCNRHGLVTGSRITMAQMIEQMTWELSGKDVCRAVCGALRTRDFAEADPPIATENA